ncbi:MAG: PDZ domain-containing protein [Verrucomicrobiota bacterium]
MKARVCWAALSAITLVAPAWSQMGQLETRPHLALAFPLTERQGGVGVEFPVLINQRAVLTPNYVMRVIYNPPTAQEAENIVTQTRSDKEVAYTRVNKLKSEKRLSRQELARQKLSRETHWPHVNMFQLALANGRSRDLHVVFVNPQSPDEFYDESLELFDGMLIGNRGSRFVDVLAVEKGSRAEAAGVQPGDQIREVGREAITGDLLAFARKYNSAKKASALSEAGGVRVLAQNGDAAPREIIIKAPTGATLNSGVMDITLEDLEATGGTGQAEEPPPPMPEIGTWRERTVQKVEERTGVDAEKILETEQAPAAQPAQPAP